MIITTIKKAKGEGIRLNAHAECRVVVAYENGRSL